jgi:type I restriction enzyme S subunit
MSTNVTNALSDLAEINPGVNTLGLSGESWVSFIPMSDVSDTGQWIVRQQRRLSEVRVGYTPFAEGDVLFAKITPCMENGKGAHTTGLINGIGFGSTEFHVLRARGDNDPRFLFHWLQARPTRTKAIAFMGGSAGQQRVQAEFFTHFRIPHIEPNEQSRIAAVLDTVDETIAATEAIITKLKQVRAGLLHDLLTRGLDEHGQLRDPIAQPEQFQDSSLGRIPCRWRVAQFHEAADIASGVTLGRNLDVAGTLELPYLRVANVQDGYLDLAEVKTIRIFPDELDRFRLRCGDVLMNEGGDYDKLGRGTVWEDQIPICLHQNHVFRVRCRPNALNCYFLAAVSGSETGKRYFLRSSKQSTNLASINSTQLNAFEIPLPSLAEQEAITKMLKAQDDRLTAETRGLVKLHALKSGLMSDLLTGRVRVPESVSAVENQS